MENTPFLGFRSRRPIRIVTRWAFGIAGLAGASIDSVSAALIEFRATIDAAQETPASTSPATGTAVMLYDVETNRFDLTVRVDNFANVVSASHLHEAAPGVPGSVVTGLGAEAVYVRTNNTIAATFADLEYGGSPQVLLSNGAYINIHSAAFPGGEVRGQLIAQPVRLYAILNAAQEVPATTSTAIGAALIDYNPGTNKIWTRISLFRFTNTLTNSHYHEAAPGVPGGVVHGLGGASVYTQTGDSYGAVFEDQTYGGDPIKLLTGLAYLNVHSNAFPPGEIRGQVHVSSRCEVSRLVNVSARGWVGTGEQVLIAGFVITGTEPIRVLATARGPSMIPAGVVDALADPVLSLHDDTSRMLVSNDNVADTFAADEAAATGFGPANANESALLVILPPGLYTTIARGAGNATGVALNEVYEIQPE